ncbi:M20 metallopeptidase family protein [Salsuginibacillus kocurii]|uniref:M20 metallopeptidase family protein n=1 Tax=Salsuginibacillus kocurii TaxID=427078 RepID=UPI00036E4106|nr:amidohydrolase [Salsuginibacillus kocurii]
MDWMKRYPVSEHIMEAVREARRTLHKHPELSHEEEKTAAYVTDFLKQLGLEVHTGLAGCGVLGVLHGKGSGPTIALRADMDALPIQEENEVSYKSKKAGVMHACGHDAHTAMLLGTASYLAEIHEQWQGTVLFVFQPAEEDAPIGGAQTMMEEGVFKEYQPDTIFAQHVWPDLPVGTFGVKAGAMMANSDRFQLIIKGAGGHASMPHQGVDTIVAANQMISALQTIISRNTDPLDSAVITVGTMQAGERYNVIPREAVLEGTVRTLTYQTKEQVKERFYQIVEQTASAMGVEAEVYYYDGYPATINDEELSSFVKDTLAKNYGEETVPQVVPSLGGEDFGRFLLHYPGVYYWLGTAIKEREVQKPLHDPMFDIDEGALRYGVEAMSLLTLEALGGKDKEDDGNGNTGEQHDR